MKLLAVIFSPLALSMLPSPALAAADPGCVCMFVAPMPPGGVAVQRGNQKLLRPAPRIVFYGDVLLITGHPNGKLVCPRIDKAGNPIEQEIVIPENPKQQPVACDTTSSPEMPVLPGIGKHKIDMHLLYMAPAPAVILTPGQSVITSQRPDFRLALPWRDGGYEIKLYADDGEVFRKSIQTKDPQPETVFKYPSDAPILKVGKTYKFEVSPGKGESSPVDEAQFTISHESVTDKVKQAIEVINRLDIDNLSKSMIRAATYEAHQMYPEAIVELTSNAQAKSDPDALRELGDLYRLSSLRQEAEKAYAASLAAGASRDSPAGQGYSWEALGVLHETSGDLKTARGDYDKARSHYDSFGASMAVKRTNDSIHRVDKL
jgi:hypothetical protein